MRRAALGGSALLVASLLAGCNGEAPVPDPPSTPTVGKPVALTFMAYGPPEELAAYEAMVEDFNTANEGITVTLVTVPDATRAMAQLRTGDAPDVFLLPRRNLAEVADGGVNQPLDELLDSRGVDFSDSYKRDSLTAFSYDNALQCMPYGISPMVMYYNTDLVDFDTIEAQGGPRPQSFSSFTFEQFAAAAEFATRPGTKGVHIDPTLTGIAPFVYSGGGEVYDDAQEPTSLALSEEGSRDALDRSLQLLREERLTLTPRELREQSALDRFRAGKLGMLAGYRSLVPELRKAPSLNFDVLPMPRLDGDATVGEISGLCLAADPETTSAAADFIVHAISTEAVSTVAEAGYLVPANNEAAESPAFLQPDRLPEHPEVFNRAIRDIVNPPLVDEVDEVQQAVQPLVYQLFYARVIDIEELTTMIDEASRSIFVPEQETPTGSPSPSPTDQSSPTG